MDDTLGGVALSEAKDRMDRAVAHAQADLAVIRTGRAAPALVEKLKVEYFGSQVPLQQLAGFTVPEARLLVIHPYDKSSIKSIERAIQHSDLGLTPSNDGQVVRLVFPQLTADRRREMVKLARHKGEEGRIAVRNLRRSARHDLEGLQRAGEITTDELDRAEKELENLTHEHVAEIERLMAQKEQELLEI